MLGQTPPYDNTGLPLQVEADETLLDGAPGRHPRFLWTGLGFGVLMLVGLSACVLLPLPSFPSTKFSRHPVPEAAFSPSQNAQRPGTRAQPTVRTYADHSYRYAEDVPWAPGNGWPSDMRGEGTMPIKEVMDIAKTKLTPLQRAISLAEATETAFTGQTTNGYMHDNEQEGTYRGAISNAALFESSAKYDAGTGWPSFYEAVFGSVIERPDPCDLSNLKDKSLHGASTEFGYIDCDIESDSGANSGASSSFGVRTEIIDARSGAHLGHLYLDGPPPTGKRYSINAGALTFVPLEGMEKKMRSMDAAQMN